MRDYPPGYTGSIAAPPSYHPEEIDRIKSFEDYEKQQAEAMRDFDFMEKLLKIGSCGMCCHFSQGDSENPDYCWECGNYFVEPWSGGFPDWCPLENAHDK